jgi:sn-glycerol 3-phosphate transport system ATP-binding protein
LLEPIGGESHLHAKLANLKQSVILSVPGRPEIGEGSSLTIYARPSDLHPFSASTGRRTDD